MSDIKTIENQKARMEKEKSSPGDFYKAFGKAMDSIAKRRDLRELVNSQGLPELKKNLSEIEESINLTNNIPDTKYQFLLEKKKMVLDRIQKLSADEKIKALQDIVSNISDYETRQKLTEEVSSLQEESEKYRREIHDIDERKQEAEMQREKQKFDIFKKKSEIWRSFLQRESVASLIGAVVLLLLTFSLIVGMVFGWESQVLSNGFLVILGYFFGQSSSRNNKDSDSGGTL